MRNPDNFARRVFFWAGVYGLIVLLPQYLTELGVGQPLTAAIQRPEQFYGFIGVASVWQVAFLIIARDVQRYRLLMLPAILEKLVFGMPAVLLYLSNRVGGDVLAFGLVDLALGALFLLAFRATRETGSGTSRWSTGIATPVPPPS